MSETEFKRKHDVLEMPTGKTRQVGFTGQWTKKKLGDHANIYRGGSPRPIESFITDDINGINWIKIGDVDPAVKYIRSTAEKIKQSGIPSTRLVHKGDLILSNSMSFGRPYILKLDGAIHDGWLVIQNYQKTFNTDFLYYALSSDAVMAQYKASAAGSSVQNLNKEKVAEVVIHAPDSLEEQERIASALSSVDELIASLDKQIAKTRDIKQGVMQRLFIGKTDAEHKTLGEVAHINKGIQFNKADMNTTGSYPVINGGTEASGYIEQYNCDKDTITVSQGGASAGYVNWLSQKFWAGAHCYLVKPNESTNNKYLYYFLKFNELAFMNSKYGGNIPALAVNTLLNFSIPIPPLAEQKCIADVLTSLDDTIEDLEAKRQKYESIKAGMMQQLLTGTIRLS